MLEFLRGRASERKVRLFAVACCRRIWERLAEEGSRHAVGVAERFADGLSSPSQLRLARGIALEGKDPAPWGGEMACAYFATAKSAWDAAEGAARTSQLVYSLAWDRARRKADRTHRAADREAVGAVARQETAAARAAQAALLRDILGDPFHGVCLQPSWLTCAVVSQSHAIYDERAFERMPELADVLQQGGCTDATILGHCRGPVLHVRGCWVVDAILGKA
jgi:hypothetical protein